MSPEPSGHLTRRQYQQTMKRHRRRVRKRRRARIRRIRLLRTLQTTRFWVRVLITAIILLLFAFWSRFAFVYDIPTYAQRGPLVGVSSYVTVKPWWFGPPLFDLGREALYPVHPIVGSNTYSILLENLGRYQVIATQPHFVWVQRVR